MGYYFHRTPTWLKSLYSSLTWDIPSGESTIYLTFDDGPIPDLTQFALDQLDKFEAKATFFCVGENIEKHPNEFERIINAGHEVANHTFNHMVGWQVSQTQYIDNIWKCQNQIEKFVGRQQRRLFRPPHGKITRNQIQKVKQEFEIIMWTYLTGDFDPKLTKEKCLTRAIKDLKADDILIFHDSLKAREKMFYALPRLLSHFTDLGYQFKSI